MTSLRVASTSLLLVGLISVAIWMTIRFNSSNPISSENTSDPAASSSITQSSIPQERIIYRGDPPYLSELPILDGNLFVNHSDDFLLLGGTNIEQVRFSASTRAGDRAIVGFRENSIAFQMEEQPYIEFSYQDSFYSLQILSRPYFFTMDFREIPDSSIELTNKLERNQVERNQVEKSEIK